MLSLERLQKRPGISRGSPRGDRKGHPRADTLSTPRQRLPLRRLPGGVGDTSPRKVRQRAAASRIHAPQVKGSAMPHSAGRSRVHLAQVHELPRSGIVADLSTSQKLDRLFRLARDKKRALVLTHDNPDPDSLASAVALAHLLERKTDIDARVVYGGIIGRAENIAFVKVLHLDVSPVSQIVFDEHDLLALVDSQQPAGNHS